jgi:hypothetical protein
MFSKKVLVYRTGLSTIAPVEPRLKCCEPRYHNNMVLHVWVYLDVFMVTFCTAVVCFTGVTAIVSEMRSD